MQAANAVISHNKGRKGKTLWTKNGGGEKITVYEANDGVDEANYVANRIITRSHGHGFKDYAVLYRTNAQSNMRSSAAAFHTASSAARASLTARRSRTCWPISA